MQVEYTFLKGQCDKGVQCLCVAKVNIAGKELSFFESRPSRAEAHKAVANLILVSKELKEYILSGPNDSTTCATGCSSKCVGCYECNDGPRNKLCPQTVHNLDLELEEYMKQRQPSPEPTRKQRQPSPEPTRKQRQPSPEPTRKQRPSRSLDEITEESLSLSEEEDTTLVKTVVARRRAPVEFYSSSDSDRR